MSDDPFSAYQSPDTPQQQPQSEPTSSASRPTSVTVFGILNLVFAGMGLCGTCAFVGQWSLLQGMPDQPPNPVFELMEENQAYSTFMIVSMALGFVFTVLLGLAGFGLLKMRPWGRQLSIVYAVYTIIASIVGVIANYVWLAQPLMEQADMAGAGPERSMAMLVAVFSVFGGCLGSVYPIILLIFMMRSNVVQAFRDQQGGNVPSY
jgi:hypothetical protein